MPVLFTVLIIIICVLLALVVLIQNPKGGGLDSTFGSAGQLGGVQKTTDFLEKSTWSLVIGLMVLCLASAAFSGNDPGDSTDDRYRDEAPLQQQAPAAQQPQQQQQPAQQQPAQQAPANQ